LSKIYSWAWSTSFDWTECWVQRFDCNGAVLNWCEEVGVQFITSECKIRYLYTNLELRRYVLRWLWCMASQMLHWTLLQWLRSITTQQSTVECCRYHSIKVSNFTFRSYKLNSNFFTPIQNRTITIESLACLYIRCFRRRICFSIWFTHGRYSRCLKVYDGMWSSIILNRVFLNVWDNVPMDLKYVCQQYSTCICFLGFIRYNKTCIRTITLAGKPTRLPRGWNMIFISWNMIFGLCDHVFWLLPIVQSN
jgi:hypothetical protein